MSQRPQRAAAVQAIKANTAALAPRRRSDSQTSIKNITSQQHFKSEDRRYDGRSSPSMDIVMQRSSHQDVRRLDMMSASSTSAPAHDDMNGGSYSSSAFPAVYWTAAEGAPAMGHSAPQPSPAAGYPAQLWGDPHAEQHSLPHYDSAPSHGMFDLHYGYSTQSNSLGLKAESGINVGLEGNLDLNDRGQREQRSFDASTSDALALLDTLPFKASSSADNDSYEDSTDSDLPPEKKKLSAAFRPRGRKKRNKCTPDQLRSLEAFFEKNRNPTGRIRLELSRKLRMPERSVQVWFQNRRAKVKTVERRGDTGSDSGRKKSCSIRLNEKDAHKPSGSQSRMARDTADQTPSVTAIPTSALCIGTWRRVSPLICFFSRRLQSLTWYLTSESIGFKLEIPWTSIRSAYFDGPSNPSIAERAEGVRVPLGHFVIDLERPPTFFMEVFRSAPVTNKNGVAEEPKVSWRQCEDFTEDHQAMTVSRHILNGPYEELRSAVQALAKCNDVLRNLIKFHDEEQRAAGAIPTGSGSTADNFGLVNQVRPVDPFVPPAGMDCGTLTVDAYGNPVNMPLQSVPMSASSNMPKSAAWHSFRSPMRGPEHPWEFDSPASVSTNLSEASLDSNQRHLGYSPYGVPTSIEASPRSGLGSSMDLNGLRIDTGGPAGISSFSAPAHMPMMGDTAMDGSRGSFGGDTSGEWDHRLGYGDMPASHHGGGEEQYSLGSSGVLEGGQMSTHAMQQAGGMDAGGLNVHFHRTGGERQEYSSHAQPGHGDGLHGGEPKIDPSQQQDSRRGSIYDTNDDHNADGAGSLLSSRRFSHVESSNHNDSPQDIAHSSDRRMSQDHKPGFASHLGPSSLAPTYSKIPSLEEDAFCGKTPTNRTSFAPALQLSQMNEGGELMPPPSGYESDEEGGVAKGRARSNTYRPAMHGGGGADRPLSSPMHTSDSNGPNSTGGPEEERGGSADGKGSPVEDAKVDGSNVDSEKRCSDGSAEQEAPGSSGLFTSPAEDVGKSDASPSSIASAQSDERGADEQL